MGFIGKLFGKERKLEKILRALYRAGKRKGELEIGKDTGNVSLASSLVSSDDEAHHAKAAEGYSGAAGNDTYSRNLDGQSAGFGAAAVPGSTVPHDKNSQTAYGATHGHQSTGSNSSGIKIGSSSKGQVVSQPPKVHRHPLGQTYGGDYADGKSPTELAVDSQKKDLKNDHPRYDNEAAPVKGHGRFFDPKDTQGGLYKSGSDQDYHSSRDSQTPVGPSAAAASTALAGGVAKGEYGKDSEATHAQLHHKNLKTKPSVYAEEEAAKRHAAELETAAYNAGRLKGASSTSLVNHASAHQKSFDPKAEHLKNKSAFNEGGLAGATAEANHEQSHTVSSKLTDQHAAVPSGYKSQGPPDKRVSGGESSDKKLQGKALAEKSFENLSGNKNLGNSSEGFSKKKSAEISGQKEFPKHVGADVGTGVEAGVASVAANAAAKNYDSGKSKTLDPAVAPSSLTGKPIENIRAAPLAASADSRGSAGLTSSETSSFGINSSSGAKSSAAAPNAAGSPKAPIDYEQKIKRLDQSIAETQREIDALAKASASPSSFGKDASGIRTDSKSDKQGSEGADARYAGHKEKSFEAPVEPKHSAIGQASLPSGQPITLNTATISDNKKKSPVGDDASFARKGSENAGTVSESFKGFSAENTTGATTEFGKPDSTGNSGSKFSTNSFPTSSASKLGARVGIDDLKSESSNATGLSFDKDGGLKKHEKAGVAERSRVSNSDAEGKINKTFGESDVSKGSLEINTDQSKSPKDGGYLESAKAAIASAGIAAASSFGYEGYSKYYNTEDHTKDVLEAQGKEQAGVVESPIDSPDSSTLGKPGDGENKPLPNSIRTRDRVEASHGTSGASQVLKDSGRDSSKDAKEQKQEGFLDKFGLGTSNAVSSGDENVHTEKRSTGSEIGSSVAGAVAGVTGAAAGAVGISKSSSGPHKVDSLVEEAASEFSDVSKEPRHKTEGGVLETSDKKESSLPDDSEPSKKKPSQAETSGIDNTKLEADIAAHNKKHGYTSGKSLIEVAEEKHPEIKKAPVHHESAEEELNDDIGARGLGSVPKEKSMHVGEVVKGKSHGESAGIEDAAHKAGFESGSKAHTVSGAATGKKEDDAKEIEHAAYVAGSKKAVTDFRKDNRPKTSGVASTSEPVVEAAVGKSRQESLEIENAAHLGGSGKSIPHEKPVLNAAAGKSNEESREIESAAVGDNFGDKQTSGTSSLKEQSDSGKPDSGSIGASIAGVVAGVAGGAAAAIGLTKTDDKNKEADDPVKKLYDDLSKTAETGEKDHEAPLKVISSDISLSGSQINKPTSASDTDAVGLSPRGKEKHAINSLVAKPVSADEGTSHVQSDFDLPASKSNHITEETENAAHEAGATKAVDDKVGAATGKSRQESIEIENAAQLRGTGGSVSHGAPILEAAAGKTKEESREIESAAAGVGSESFSASGARNSKAGPVTDAATGKSRQESVEIENAAHLGGKEYSGSYSKPIENAVTGKSKEESKEIEDAAFGANHKLNSFLPSDVEKEAYISGYEKGSKTQSSSEKVAGVSNISGVTGPSLAALASRDVTSGKKERISQTGPGTADTPRPVIEVIGIPDRDEAQKLAQKTSRELLAKGEDLTGAKIIIDANRQEIFKESLNKKDSLNVAAADSVRNNLSGEAARMTQPYASYNNSQHDIDGSRYHKAHEQVKEKLENEAQKGHLGNIPSEGHTHKSGSDQSATQAGNHVTRTLGSGGATSSSGQSAPVGLGQTTGHTNVDASFFDSPKEIDDGANNISHEKAKSILEHEASKGKLGNVLPSSGGEGVLSDLGNAGTREYHPEGSSTEARKHSYSHKNEQKGKDVSYTEVTVLGEPDTKRAQALAQEAVFSLQGRKDILEVKELKVDAYTGSICDQDGRFIAQLSQRRLSQSETSKRRKSSGGIVNLHSASSAKSSPTASEGVVASEQASKSHGLDENAAAGVKQKTAQGPFLDKYNLATAQNTYKTDETLKMPGSFF